ncbi:MAG TPA: hypothetical protein VGS80_25635, partial [Ktedonobacterales bacterium]|nr:hypothetical protein [Ktedonobacterales bacterium]
MANRRKPGSPQQRAWRRSLQVVLGLLAVLLLGYLAVFSYHFAQIQLGPFAPLAAILTAALLLAVLGPPLLVRYHRRLRAALGQAIQGFGALLAATRLPQRFARRFPRFSRWLVARFTPGRPAGLALTVWVAAALLFLEQVIELLLEVASGGSVPALDRRSEHLVAPIRTPEL